MNLPKTFTGSTSNACGCSPCAINMRSERRESLLSTTQNELVLAANQVSNPLSLCGFGDRIHVKKRKCEIG